MLNIMIIVGSTRRDRLGDKVSQWVQDNIEQRDDISVDVADLKEVNLPFYDERAPIGALNDEFAHTQGKSWNERLKAANGFIMITPEYNHGPPAALKNAIDYGWTGWHYKPVSFVSYSIGAIAGARAVEQLRLVCQGVKLLPLPTAIHIPRVQNTLFGDEKTGRHATTKTLSNALDELVTIGNKLNR
jgi:NAD(P)H-dependent FMN reductase